ncbi:MAG: hypothetical protein SFV24_17885 [Gemmatimonadales bacterium]|jgi:hypothetical protein|nr:hypothetical protein [Gemmatimonadales bacterium]
MALTSSALPNPVVRETYWNLDIHHSCWLSFLISALLDFIPAGVLRLIGGDNAIHQLIRTPERWLSILLTFFHAFFLA